MDLQLTTVLIALIFSVVSTVFYLVNSIRSVFYKDDVHVNEHKPGDVTIVVPVYSEDAHVFGEVIETLSNQGSDLIVVGDGVVEPYKKIAEHFGGRFILNEKRGGKRACMVLAMKYVETPFVLFVDSDTDVPKDAVSKLLSKFEPDVGGVGANLSVDIDDSAVSYSSEFVERSREVVNKALSVSGSVILLEGPCAMYRTSIVKPFILSPEFKEFQVFGRKNLQGMGDDRQLTGHVIRSNYRAVKNYDVTVKTRAKKDYKAYVRQQVRWMRTSWYYFFKDVFGTSKKAGPFYTFELVFIYVLPVVILALTLAQVYFIFANHFFFYFVQALLTGNALPLLHLSTISHLFGSRALMILRFLSTIVGGFGTVAFGVAISTNMFKGKLKTFAFGGVALIIMFVTFFYGLLTVWKQS